MVVENVRYWRSVVRFVDPGGARRRRVLWAPALCERQRREGEVDMNNYPGIRVMIRVMHDGKTVAEIRLSRVPCAHEVVRWGYPSAFEGRVMSVTHCSDERLDAEIELAYAPRLV
jgi:hypothetical protein